MADGLAMHDVFQKVATDEGESDDDEKLLIDDYTIEPYENEVEEEDALLSINADPVNAGRKNEAPHVTTAEEPISDQSETEQSRSSEYESLPAGKRGPNSASNYKSRPPIPDFTHSRQEQNSTNRFAH